MEGSILLKNGEIEDAIALYVKQKGYNLRPILASDKRIAEHPGISVSLSHQKMERSSDLYEYSASICVSFSEDYECPQCRESEPYCFGTIDTAPQDLADELRKKMKGEK